MADSSKKGGRKKTWYEIYWPDAVNSHANGTKGVLNSRRVSSKQEGKKLYNMLKELQVEFEKTGAESPLLKGTGSYVAACKRNLKQFST